MESSKKSNEEFAVDMFRCHSRQCSHILYAQICDYFRRQNIRFRHLDEFFNEGYAHLFKVSIDIININSNSSDGNYFYKCTFIEVAITIWSIPKHLEYLFY